MAKSKGEFEIRPYVGSVGGMQGNCREPGCGQASTALDRNGRCWRHEGWLGSWAGVPGREAQAARKG